MPWPLLPPDPDMPIPGYRVDDGDWFATPITMTGMRPHTEQAKMRFRVGTQPAGVWLPNEQSKAKLIYSGVLISHLKGETLTSEWLDNGGRTRTDSLFLKTVPQMPARITSVSHTCFGDRVTIQAKVNIPKTGSYSLVIAPYAVKMPTYSQYVDYVQTGTWVSINDDGRVDATVRQIPNVKTYAVFIASKVPSVMRVESTVWMQTI